MGVQEVRPDRGDTEPAGVYTFFYGNRIRILKKVRVFCVHKGTISAVKRVEFISDKM
jgi:hypothetical protein